MIRKLLLIGVAALLAAFWMRQAFIAEPTNAAQTPPSQQTQPVGTSGSSGAKPGSFDAEIGRHAQQMIELDFFGQFYAAKHRPRMIHIIATQ